MLPMGVYDHFLMSDGTAAQVKLFDCAMRGYSPGDRVPRGGNYSVALREGGYANVADGVYEGWSEAPTHGTVLDKWGNPFTADTSGLLDHDAYLFDPAGS